jgi:hypothetical protein
MPSSTLLLAVNLVVLALSVTTGLRPWLAIALAPVLLVGVYLVRRDQQNMPLTSSD